jgi:tyrosyl-tRNA synthetase
MTKINEINRHRVIEQQVVEINEVTFPPVKEQMDAILQGTEEVITEEDLERKLEKSFREGVPLKVKQGFDPTSPDIHLGHTISIEKLRTFQEMGHEVVFLVGDFTAMIGDPSEQDVTRPRLSKEEIEANAATYKEQAFKILDPKKSKLEFNNSWLSKLNFEEVIKIASHYTVARMLERDDFSNRYADNRPISIHEFLYPLAQAYDSVAIRADVEIGGTDQKFNLLLGRTIQKEFGQDPQALVLLPLLVGTDGERKMSKSLGNYIGITDLPQDMYGKVMSIPDELIAPYYRFVTDITEDELKTIEKDIAGGKVNPRDLKRRLASLIVVKFHSEEDAREAEKAFDRIFVEKDLPEDIPEKTVTIDGEVVWLPGLIRELGLLQTGGEGKRLIQQGGVYIDGKRAEDENFKIPESREIVMKVGKRKFIRIKFAG